MAISVTDEETLKVRSDSCSSGNGDGRCEYEEGNERMIRLTKMDG